MQHVSLQVNVCVDAPVWYLVRGRGAVKGALRGPIHGRHGCPGQRRGSRGPIGRQGSPTPVGDGQGDGGTVGTPSQGVGGGTLHRGCGGRWGGQGGGSAGALHLCGPHKRVVGCSVIGCVQKV